MNVGREIKLELVNSGRSQRWLSEKTGIKYRHLNAALNGDRQLHFDEFAKIIWALEKSASDFILPTSPESQAEQQDKAS